MRRMLLVPVLLGLAACGGASSGVTVGDTVATTTIPAPTTAATTPTTRPAASTIPPPVGSTAPDIVEVPPTVGECRPVAGLDVINGASDPRPAVPCGGHGFETVGVLGLTSDVYPALPDGTVSDDAAAVSDQCPPLSRAYTGFPAVPDGEVPSYVIGSFYVPTRSSWDEGQRWLRCDISFVAGVDDSLVAPIATTLAGVWNTDQLASLLVCISAEQAQVTCAEPHLGEVLEARADAGTTGPDEPYPGSDAVLQRNTTWCAETIRAVTGADVTDAASPFVDLMQAPSQELWEQGDRSVLCGAQYRDDRVVTGTLRRPGTA